MRYSTKEEEGDKEEEKKEEEYSTPELLITIHIL